jgi:anthranilate phosphoribosyltransferase
MIKEAISEIIEGRDISLKLTSKVMKEIMSGETTSAQIAAFITALRMKGETIEEITACAQIMRDKAERLDINTDILVDTCGTGGDNSYTFNISTLGALVVAGAEIKVAKHGNKSVSSKCGSADLLENLGVNIKLEPAKVKRCIEEVGIGFLFAPAFHKAMKYAMPPRKEIGIRTIFNILGPLTNPAKPNVQLLGVSDGSLTEPMARVLKNLGSRAGLVVHGEDGYDEISLTGRTKISRLKEGKVDTYYITPEEVGFKRIKPEEIKAGTIEENLKIARRILDGEKSAGRDVVIINTAHIFVLIDRAKDIKEASQMAAEIIDSGKAKNKLEQLVDLSNKV